MAKKQFNIRLDDEQKEKLQKIAETESKKTGYSINITGLIRRILNEFIDNYGKQKSK